MSLETRILASGSGWRAADVICTAGPDDPAFEEQHDAVCISAVTDGMFRYRGTQGAALLAPGSLLLGNQHHCFACSHEHGTGDRCLSFHFTPQFMESVVAGVPGARRIEFGRPALPLLPELLPIAAAAEAARDSGDSDELQELALRLAGAVAAILAGSGKSTRAPTLRDERRIALALRRIAALACEPAHATAPLSLDNLAREAAMSPYHFLRTFRAVVGLTPHQFILQMRMHHAALRLRRSNETIAAIAFDCGFGDLSTFNCRFHRLMGAPPSKYRMAVSHGRA
jgi:AraC-like DNA-binding protein